jgi:hypothetical protein
MSVAASCGVSVVDTDCIGVGMIMFCMLKAAMLIVSVLCPY